MANKYTPPTITVESRADGFYLMATSYAQTQPCGERLFRGEPWPVIKFSHATREAAEADAAILRQYLADCASGKRPDREQKSGWWQS